MAVDTKQKRMSAMSNSAPWRGTMVDPAESGFTQGNRQAAAFLYSGIAASAPGGASIVVLERAQFRRIFSLVFGRVN